MVVRKYFRTTVPYFRTILFARVCCTNEGTFEGTVRVLYVVLRRNYSTMLLPDGNNINTHTVDNLSLKVRVVYVVLFYTV